MMVDCSTQLYWVAATEDPCSHELMAGGGATYSLQSLTQDVGLTLDCFTNDRDTPAFTPGPGSYKPPAALVVAPFGLMGTSRTTERQSCLCTKHTCPHLCPPRLRAMGALEPVSAWLSTAEAWEHAKCFWHELRCSLMYT